MPVKTDENTDDRFIDWTLADDRICMRSSSGDHILSAVDIVRIEFKGESSVCGTSLKTRPSEHFPDLHFNRFPCDFRIKLNMPSDMIQHPSLELQAISDGQSKLIHRIPESDQIIIGGKEWYSIAPENIIEIRNVLKTGGVSEFGAISLRQALNLLTINSSLVSVFPAPSMPTDSSPADTGCEQVLTLLSEHGFRASLYPYQKKGFFWLKSISEEGLGCILADEMGLGKTLQIITLLSYFKIKWKQPSLIIAPSTLLENWRREFARFSPEISVHVHSGNKRTGFPSQLRRHDIVLSSYDTVVRDQGLFGMVEWAFVVLDEAQAIKNHVTHRAMAAKALTRKIGIAVTGTPVENKLADL